MRRLWTTVIVAAVASLSADCHLAGLCSSGIGAAASHLPACDPELARQGSRATPLNELGLVSLLQVRTAFSQTSVDTNPDVAIPEDVLGPGGELNDTASPEHAQQPSSHDNVSAGTSAEGNSRTNSSASSAFSLARLRQLPAKEMGVLVMTSVLIPIMEAAELHWKWALLAFCLVVVLFLQAALQRSGVFGDASPLKATRLSKKDADLLDQTNYHMG